MKYLQILFYFGLLLCGCTPSVDQHQEMTYLVRSVRINAIINEATSKAGVISNGVYGVAVPTNIYVDLLYNKKFGKDFQELIADQIFLEAVLKRQGPFSKRSGGGELGTRKLLSALQIRTFSFDRALPQPDV